MLRDAEIWSIQEVEGFPAEIQRTTFTENLKGPIYGEVDVRDSWSVHVVTGAGTQSRYRRPCGRCRVRTGSARNRELGGIEPVRAGPARIVKAGSNRTIRTIGESGCAEAAGLEGTAVTASKDGEWSAGMR